MVTYGVLPLNGLELASESSSSLASWPQLFDLSLPPPGEICGITSAW